jgi:hypothetical protein
MTKNEVVQLLSWLEEVFPDRIKFGGNYIPNAEAKDKLAEAWLEVRENRK